MPMYRIYATEEVLYMREIEASCQDDAKKIFMEEFENNDIIDGRGAEITEVERIKNV